MIYASVIQWGNKEIYLSADDYSILGIAFAKPEDVIWKENMVLLECKKQLQEYLKGKRKIFDVPIRFNGTDFQNVVWQKLLAIPYGQVVSYGDLATVIGKPKAARAVGSACNKNPIAVIIPCHRVVGKSGSLTGYAGGISIKEELLELEKRSLK